MRLYVNGTAADFTPPINVSQLLLQLEHQHETVAVAVGSAFLPRGKWESHYLQENEEIEIVAPMQGG